MSILKLEDYQSHIVVQGKKSIHVCPVSMFRDIINFKLKISDIADFNDFFPKIIKEWLNNIIK